MDSWSSSSVFCSTNANNYFAPKQVYIRNIMKLNLVLYEQISSTKKYFNSWAGRCYLRRRLRVNYAKPSPSTESSATLHHLNAAWRKWLKSTPVSPKIKMILINPVHPETPKIPCGTPKVWPLGATNHNPPLKGSPPLPNPQQQLTN